ncbi:hypothetical protein PRIPAC_91586, partial [Pristionchus pacificus]
PISRPHQSHRPFSSLHSAVLPTAHVLLQKLDGDRAAVLGFRSGEFKLDPITHPLHQCVSHLCPLLRADNQKAYVQKETDEGLTTSRSHHFHCRVLCFHR